MINLLPDEYKQEIRAGRTNVLLVRYIMIMLVAVVVLSGMLAASYVALTSAQQVSETKVAENQQRVGVYQNIRSQSDAFRADLSTARGILDSQVSYSKLIYKIAGMVPKNVVLDELKLDPQTFGSTMTMTASAKSFSDATKLKDSFSSNNEVFSQVSLQTIRSGDAASADNPYPVKVNLSVVINRSALQ